MDGRQEAGNSWSFSIMFKRRRDDDDDDDDDNGLAFCPPFSRVFFFAFLSFRTSLIFRLSHIMILLLWLLAAGWEQFFALLLEKLLLLDD